MIYFYKITVIPKWYTSIDWYLNISSPSRNRNDFQHGIDSFDWETQYLFYICLEFNNSYLPFESYDIEKYIWKIDPYIYLEYFSQFFFY